MEGIDNGTTPDDAEDQGNDNNATPNQPYGPTGIFDNEDPEDLEDGEDSNYLHEFEEDVSLRHKDFIILIYYMFFSTSYAKDIVVLLFHHTFLQNMSKLMFLNLPNY